MYAYLTESAHELSHLKILLFDEYYIEKKKNYKQFLVLTDLGKSNRWTHFDKKTE